MVFATWKLRMHLIYFLIAHLLGLVGQLGEVIHTSILSLLSL